MEKTGHLYEGPTRSESRAKGPTREQKIPIKLPTPNPPSMYSIVFRSYCQLTMARRLRAPRAIRCCSGSLRNKISLDTMTKVSASCSTNQPTALKVSLGIVNPESGDVGVGGPVIRQEVDLIILCASGTFARST